MVTDTLSQFGTSMKEATSLSVTETDSEIEAPAAPVHVYLDGIRV